MQEFVYIYDGVPSFIMGKPLTDKLLMALCGTAVSARPLELVATSGQVTIYYESDRITGVLLSIS